MPLEFVFDYGKKLVCQQCLCVACVCGRYHDVMYTLLVGGKVVCHLQILQIESKRKIPLISLGWHSRAFGFICFNTIEII